MCMTILVDSCYRARVAHVRIPESAAPVRGLSYWRINVPPK